MGAKNQVFASIAVNKLKTGGTMMAKVASAGAESVFEKAGTNRYWGDIQRQSDC